MTKKTTATLLILLLFFSSTPQPITASYAPPTVITEALFVDIARDLELLNSWLTNQYYIQETIDALRYQNYQEILALHAVDQKLFEESLKYYLQSSAERAIAIYAEIYTSLEALLPPT